MVAFGSPVVPDVKPSKATSSLPVLTASNKTGFSSAMLSRSASWLDVPSNPTTDLRYGLSAAQVCSSSSSRVSHSAWLICALSTMVPSSPARSMGMVLTTTAPTLLAASQHATIAGLLAERINTRLPGSTPRSSTSTWAMRLVQSVSSL